MNPFFSPGAPLYLASASPRRQALLRELGVPHQVLVPALVEEPDPAWGPRERAVRLALGKARAVAGGLREGLILGADTVVVVEGRLLGKPRSPEEAQDMLASLEGKIHEVMTGVAILRRPDGRTRTDCARTLVHMRSLEPEEVAAYAQSGEPMDKAGAYGIQGYASALVDRVEGCYFNVVGLPVALLAGMLKDFTVDGGEGA